MQTKGRSQQSKAHSRPPQGRRQRGAELQNVYLRNSRVPEPTRRLASLVQRKPRILC